MIVVDIIVMLALSAAAGAGVGGGGLLVVYLTLIKDSPSNVAAALNLLFYIIAAVSSTILGGVRKTGINVRAAITCSALAIPGAYLGSVARNSAPEDLIRIIFGVMLIVAGLSVGVPSLRKIIKAREKEKPV